VRDNVVYWKTKRKIKGDLQRSLQTTEEAAERHNTPDTEEALIPKAQKPKEGLKQGTSTAGGKRAK